MIMIMTMVVMIMIISPIHTTQANPGSTWDKLTQVRPKLVILCEQESSDNPGWMQDKHAHKFKFRGNGGQ